MSKAELLLYQRKEQLKNLVIIKYLHIKTCFENITGNHKRIKNKMKQYVSEDKFGFRSLRMIFELRLDKYLNTVIIQI